jgi:hypothetical protein
MSDTARLVSPTPISAGAAPIPAPVLAVPWYIWAAVLAVSSAVIGVQWDIAWHRSIGRDTFWSPPHVAIYLAGVLAGLTCGYLILSTTFAGTQATRAASVRIWGFRGPLGAFIAAWGGIAMIASAPFDNWWHNTYGLDVKILSPPHSVLLLGILAIQFGPLLLIAGMMNRTTGPVRATLVAMFLYVGGFVLAILLTFEMEFTGRAVQHSATCYRFVATVAPLMLIATGRASGHRFGATLVATAYSVLMIGLLWILPLVPATPKLGPVYYQVTHLCPGDFPMLLFAPALAMDLMTPRLATRAAWLQAVILGTLFFVIFVPLQWVFADFVMSPYGRNWVFGANNFGYAAKRTWHEFRYTFHDLDGSPAAFRVQLALGLVVSIVTARLGLMWAMFMRGLWR